MNWLSDPGSLAESTSSFDWGTLFAVIVGALAAFGGPFLHKLYDGKKEREALLAGIRGEIAGILETVRHRKYREAIVTIIAISEERVETGEKALKDYSVSVTEDYFAVFAGNVGRIGSLGKYDADRVCRFYVLAKSVLEDMKTDWSELDITAAQQAERYRELLVILDRALELGDSIVSN